MIGIIATIQNARLEFRAQSPIIHVAINSFCWIGILVQFLLVELCLSVYQIMSVITIDISAKTDRDSGLDSLYETNMNTLE